MESRDNRGFRERPPILYTKRDLLDLFRNGIPFLSSRNFNITNVAIDSRETRYGSLFFALRGKVHDGHAFIKRASEAGASCIIAEYIPEEVKTAVEMGHLSVIVVKDSLEALTNLAKYNRSRLGATVIGITGNIGKTTTKEIMAQTLSSFFKVHYAPKTYNNHVGMPYTLANTPLDVDIVVLEMGMNHAGEIEHLSNIAKPNIGIITTIAPAHVEFFDSVDDIVKAKAEIFKGMPSDGVVILNQDNIYYDQLATYAKQEGLKNIFRIGTPASHLYITNHEFTDRFSTKFSICFKSPNDSQIIDCETAGISYHNALNTLFTFAVARLLKLDLAEVSTRISEIPMVDGRGNIERICFKDNETVKNVIVVNDSYNSSPEALKTAIRAVSNLSKKYENSRMVAVIGDMLELGSKSEEYHLSILKELVDHNVGAVFTIGKHMKIVYDGLPDNVVKMHFDDVRPLVNKIRGLLENNDVILVKGSRSMALESIIYKIIG